MAMRHAHSQSFATQAAAVAAGHVGAGPAFVHKHRAVPVKIDLTFKPGPTLLQRSGKVLLSGMRGLLLRVRWWRAKKRHSVP
jgi:hypothetical protein